jgi:serine/threonine protein kinase
MATFMAPTQQRHLPEGALLQDGKYRVINVLGQGGFGITYLAEHKNFGEVAIKELFLSSGTAHCSRENTTQRHVIAHFDALQFDDFKKRFLDEARTLYKLRDVKGVVKVIDIFEENGTVYFSMEYLNGDKLEDYVKKRTKLPEKEGIRIIESVARTLAEIHKRNVLHRDIKPANIIVTRAGEAYLIDFGIARSYADDIADTHTTFHSPRYSPPEQKIAKVRMGTYSDVYSLGATAYFVFTGTPPQSLEERITEDYQPPQYLVPNLSDSLNETITHSLTIREKERIQTMDDFLMALGKPSYKDTDSPSPIRPPQYEPSSDEAIRFVVPNKPKNMPVEDDVTKFEPTVVPKPPKPIVQDDVTRFEPPVVSKPPKPVVQDDATVILTPPPPKAMEKPQVGKPIVEDDKTVLDILPPVAPPVIEEDTEKTLIFGQDINPKEPLAPKLPFNWKEWLKTRDGRIVSGSVVLSIVGIIATVVSPMVCKPEYKNLQPVPATTSDVPVPKPADTTAQIAIVAPIVALPVDSPKVVNKPAVAAKPTKKDKPKSQKEEQANTTTSTPWVPAPVTTPTVTVKEPVATPNNSDRPYVGRHTGVTLNQDLSCTVKGEEGTYRINGETNDWIRLKCTTNSGKDYLVFYYKKTKTVKLEDK